MFRLAKKGPVEYLEAKELSGLEFVTHAFCTRRTGVSKGGFESLNVGDLVGDEPQNVIANLNLIKRAFAIPENGLITSRQVHGDRIIVIGKKDRLPVSLPECDGFVTDRPGIALGIKTADCLPLLFVDRRLRVAGAVHAGWRGTALGIAEKMVELFSRRFSSRKEDILVLAGPAIGPCCYEVDAPVFEAFAARKEEKELFPEVADQERWMFDILLANRLQLLRAGLPGNNILAANRCTSCHQELFFSHRAARGKEEGRQLSIIMINGHLPGSGSRHGQYGYVDFCGSFQHNDPEWNA